MDDRNLELAWVGAPPDAKSLCSVDLVDISVVGDLLCSCMDGYGLITKEGWRYLIATHGIETLLEIDSKNWDWFGGERDQLIDNAKIGGYDPESDQFGTWDNNVGFTPESAA